MKRGWRNDPAWVAYYEKRDRERGERRMAMAKAEIQSQMNANDVERSMRALKWPTAKLVG